MPQLRLAGLIVCLAACHPQVAAAPHPAPPTPPVSQPAPPTVEAPPGEIPVDSADIPRLLAAMSIRDKIAQVVIPWVPGNYAAFDDSLFERFSGWVDSLHVGGLLISTGSPLDVAAKLNRLQDRSVLPLLVAADLEGGSAIRLAGGTWFPGNMGVAAAGGESDAYEVGRISALEGRAVGIQLALAPVADVNNNPANPIINTRSFGESPQVVARLVAATVRGLQEHGMLATVKHFPGHGDTGTDSHLAVPVIDATWARLDSIELVPFRAAIGAGVAAVMTGHIAIPVLDSGRTRPVTMAPEVLAEVLRDSLHFQGLTVTDALNMGGILNGYGPGEGVVRAFLAGNDLLIQPSDPRIAIDALALAVSQGRLTEARIDQSVRKVVELKIGLGLFRRRTMTLDSIPYVVGSQEFQRVARDIAQRSIVLVRDSMGVVDALRRGPRPVTIIAYGDENNPAAGATLANELRATGYPVTLFRLYPVSGPASYDSARVAIGRNGTTLFVAAVKASAWRGTITIPDATAALIEQTAQRRPVVLVSLGSPYLLSQTPHVAGYVLGWSTNPISEAAVARALAGLANISGRLPISLPPAYPIGAGLRRSAP